NASGIIVGRAVGSGNSLLYKRAFSFSFSWGFGSGLFLSLVIFLFGSELVGLFTGIGEVKESAIMLLSWLAIFPLVSFWGLQLEGIFSGATEAGYIRNAILFALIIFVAVIYYFVPVLRAHGIWFAFILFSLGRSIFLSLYIKSLYKKKMEPFIQLENQIV
ncbi:MATE family efflux transporter, partial [Gracilibacillus oryzae]